MLVRAGGNPLFAEQYAQMADQSAGAGPAVPESVQGILATRD